MTTPTPLRRLSRGGVGVVLAGGLIASFALPASAAVAAPAAAAQFILTNMMPVSNPPTPVERSAGVVAKRTIGYSVQGRRIVARLYGSATATRIGVMIGSMHGNELGGIPVAKRLEKLGAPSGSAMWVIRNLNPDGARKYQRQNAHKVDLNRNGTYLWQGTALSREYYPGPAPASEPETKAYISFLEAVKPDVVLIYHQHGNGVDSYRQKNAGLTQGLAAKMKLAVKSFDCLGECRGTLAGWFNTAQAGAALTVELPAKVTTKRVKRWASAARWSIGYVPDVNR
jgi:protein MpaA